jgi:hypothetical protein
LVLRFSLKVFKEVPLCEKITHLNGNQDTHFTVYSLVHMEFKCFGISSLSAMVSEIMAVTYFIFYF